MECREMEPIVYGIKKKYASCMKVERVNFHEWTTWHDLLLPMVSPEFDLLSGSKEVIHRWIGVTDEEEFHAVLEPLCS
jgi:hypothetical protein